MQNTDWAEAGPKMLEAIKLSLPLIMATSGDRVKQTVQVIGLLSRAIEAGEGVRQGKGAAAPEVAS